jgi:hypothetical protein
MHRLGVGEPCAHLPTAAQPFARGQVPPHIAFVRRQGVAQRLICRRIFTALPIGLVHFYDFPQTFALVTADRADAAGKRAAEKSACEFFTPKYSSLAIQSYKSFLWPSASFHSAAEKCS